MDIVSLMPLLIMTVVFMALGGLYLSLKLFSFALGLIENFMKGK